MSEITKADLAQQLGAQLPLKDIHLPEEIGLWPPAPGWWVLAAVLIGLIALAIWQWRRYQRHPVTLALQELKQIDTDHQQAAARALAWSTLLKRTALSLYPRTQVASLSGDEWREFLCKEVGGEAEVAALQMAVLKPGSDLDEQAVKRWIARWLKAQRRRKVAHV